MKSTAMYTFVSMVGSFPNMNSAKNQFFPKHLFYFFPIQWETEQALNYKEKRHTHTRLQSMSSPHLRRTHIDNKFVVP
ncbi:hypothetical protein IMY05_019G0077400 [Salix suchowensis]|nr:hypothetical protein IMY05_019G0077400 [Salix suchowensis]